MSAQFARHVAVVGSGVAGLTAAHVLGTRPRVTLYEADTGSAGTPTRTWYDGDRHRHRLHRAQRAHLPQPAAALRRARGADPGVRDVDVGALTTTTGLEYAGALGLRGLFPTWRNALRPSYLRMLAEIPRFHRMARSACCSTTLDRRRRSTTRTRRCASFLERGGFSPLFRTHFMESLVACVWSCDPAVALDYPARYLFTFLQHHGMLGVFGSPQWRTVTGGSREYVGAWPPASPTCAPAPRSPRSSRRPPASRSPTATAGRHLRRGRGRDPPGPGAGDAGRADRHAARRALGDAVLLQHRPAAHRHRACCRAAIAPGRRGTTCAVSSARPATVHRQLRHDPSHAAAGPADGHGTSSPSAARTSSTRRRSSTRWSTSTRSTRPLRSPPSAGCPECDSDRVVFAGAWHGWGFHEDGARSGVEAAARLGVDRGCGRSRCPSRRGRYDTPSGTPAAGRSGAPSRTARRTWLVDLDHLPDHGVLAGSRRATTSATPTRPCEPTSSTFLAATA